ncbi:MAG: FecR family protein [Ginsengibacter sp.]
MPDKLPSDMRSEILLEKFFENTCTKKELEELLTLAENEESEDDLTNAMKKHWVNPGNIHPISEEKLSAKFLDLMEHARSMDIETVRPSKVKRFSKILSYAAAVIILCLLSITAYYYYNHNNTEADKIVQNIPVLPESNEILPGGNKATLTLSNGQVIDLTNTQNGTLPTQSAIKIEKSNGLLSYSPENNKISEMNFNTISTPNGGQYQLILSDGTKVWLNAASSLKYPISFQGTERKVELTGEAYFEVASDKSKPFRVASKDQEVVVLGTHFNINAYGNEGSSQTTLLEGSVKVNVHNNIKLLKPGQQARVLPSSEIKIINNVETDAVIAWKNEKFQFVKADIQTVMRQIERWYDVTVEYRADISTHFGGSISRNVNLDQVLNILQQTEKVRFEVKGKKIIVLPPASKNK